MVAEGRLEASWKSSFGLVFACLRSRDTRQVRVPEQADASTIDSGYEVSAKLSRPIDLQRIC
jgi:hypothetical protein